MKWPIILEGNYVLLRPPSDSDVLGLSQAARDGGIWNNPYAFFHTKITCLDIDERGFNLYSSFRLNVTKH
jgi:hypothetical protein